MFWAAPIFAQTLFEPAAAPLGGRSTQVLNISSTPQQKLGSLIIGQSDIQKRLCLNGLNTAANIDQTNDDASAGNPNGRCIRSWSDVVYSLGCTFVQLTKADPNPATAADPSTYTSYQNGYLRLRGAGSDAQANTYLTQSNNNLAAGSTTALYASATQIEDYAGSFSGRVRIEPTAASFGRLCFLGTDPSQCIQQWTDIPGANYNDQLTLQLKSSPVFETGNVWLQKALNAGAVVLGAPPPLTPAGTVTPYCGDGMCSQDISENDSASDTYCPLDCENSPLAAVSPSTISGGVRLHITPAAFTSGTQPYILVVRSTNQNFSFTPTDGVLYSVPSGDATYTVVYFQQQPDMTAFNVDDTSIGVPIGTTVYYHVYQGNAFPRYRQAAVNYTSVSRASG